MNAIKAQRAITLKKQGQSDSFVREVLRLTAGQLDRALARGAGRKAERENPTEPVQQLNKRLHDAKSQPAAILKARELLSLGMAPLEVCKQLGLTMQDLKNFLSPEWGGFE